ncbi:MAG: ATP--guanido phosphotransferase [Planctomycetota bacterium]
MTLTTIQNDDFAQRLGSWMTAAGPESDVVVSCRARLARNLADEAFISRLDEARADALADRLRDVLDQGIADGKALGDDSGHWVDIRESGPVTRLLLRERHLVSRDLAPIEEQRTVQRGRSVFFTKSETVSAMVNEEDHLRLQGYAGGLDLERAWQRARDLDVLLEKSVDYAVSEQLGYLTACPTNVGTGMRASVMLHLPALGIVRSELEKVFSSAQRTGLAVRGMYGEGSRAAGDLYQISNQVTLGRSEQDLIGDLLALVPKIVAFERKIRQALLEEREDPLQERVARSFGMLSNARMMPSDVALMHLSNLRLGVALGLFDRLSLEELNGLSIQIQRGHVQVRAGGSGDDRLLDSQERDRLRATFLRDRLGNPPEA